jgi:alkanesulfonate monooxygenase SsuD/methylene tetrahydromethanopterin reductase-like flavin-dependent oxidoreductase (luciferase family)
VTSATTTFGIRLPNSGPFAAPASIREFATLSEALGFETLWVHDHLAWPHHRRTHFAAGSVEAVTDEPPSFYESVATIAYVAGLTRRIKVGIAGLVLPWRDPRVLAKQFATLADLADGRLVPALAIGRFEDEFVAQQVDYHQRGRITDEYLACLAAILGPEAKTDFQSARVQFTAAEYFPKASELPLWICGMSPQARRRVALYGQGWLPGGMTPDEYRASVADLDAEMARHGRTAREVERGNEIFTTIAESDAAALAISRASLEHQWGDVDRGLARSLVGSAETIRYRIKEYVAAGVSHFEIKFICHDMPMMRRMIEDYARLVVPRIR